MSAARLREAAALMRSRAEAARYWQFENGESRLIGWHAYSELAHDPFDPAHAEHIASWHPDVALAVADWLESVCNRRERSYYPSYGAKDADWNHALAVANAYLGAAS